MTQKEKVKRHKLNQKVYHLLAETTKNRTRCGRPIEERGKPQVLLAASEEKAVGTICGRCKAIKAGKPVVEKSAGTRGKRLGVSKLIASALQRGESSDAIITRLRREIPESRAGKPEIAWVKGAVKRGRQFA